ncbi:MAG: hypothetical protein ABI670_04480 [Chloroflexota bacterium]
MIALENPVGAKTQTVNYNFHDIFRLSIKTEDVAALRHFNDEYSRFEDKSGGKVDLEVSIGNFAFTPQEDVTNFGKYHLSGDWIYGSARYKVAWWRFALKGMMTPTAELYFYGGPFAPYFLQHFLVEQIMRYKIALKGYLLVHGGCVADRGNSILFPGLGHAGKTALAVQQVLAGRKFQADDYTVVSSAGQTYSYPRRLHISDHTNDACLDASKNLSVRHRVSMKAKRLIYYLTLKYGDLDEALQMDELVPGAVIEEVARMGAVILLTSSSSDKLKGPKFIDPDTLVNRLMAINLLEGKPFNDILLGLHYAGQAPAPTELWGREREVLRRALIGVPGYEVLVPTHGTNPSAAVEGTSRILNSLMEKMTYAVPV